MDDEVAQSEHPSGDGTIRWDTLPEIWDPQEPAISAIFKQLPAAIGVPGMHLFWRLLANIPDFLIPAWATITTILQAPAFEPAAERLTESAFIVEAVGLPSHKAFRGDLVRAEIDADFRGKIEHFNDASQYGLVRLLLLISTVRAGVRAAPATRPPNIRVNRPAATSRDWVEVPPLREGEGSTLALALLEQIRLQHHQPYVDDYYRSLARIVDYLSAAWNAIRPLVGDPEYLARATALCTMASDFAGTLPPAASLQSTLSNLDLKQSAIVRALLDYFAEELLPQTLMDVTLIKALTSGPEHAIPHSTFSVERPDQ